MRITYTHYDIKRPLDHNNLQPFYNIISLKFCWPFCENPLIVFKRCVIEIGILRITLVLLVIKLSFDRTNLPLFLHYLRSNYISTLPSYNFYNLLFVKYCSIGFWFSSLFHWLLAFFFIPIRSSFIYPESFQRVC